LINWVSRNVTQQTPYAELRWASQAQRQKYFYFRIITSLPTNKKCKRFHPNHQIDRFKKQNGKFAKKRGDGVKSSLNEEKYCL